MYVAIPGWESGALLKELPNSDADASAWLEDAQYLCEETGDYPSFQGHCRVVVGAGGLNLPGWEVLRPPGMCSDLPCSALSMYSPAMYSLKPRFIEPGVVPVPSRDSTDHMGKRKKRSGDETHEALERSPWASFDGESVTEVLALSIAESEDDILVDYGLVYSHEFYSDRYDEQKGTLDLDDQSLFKLTPMPKPGYMWMIVISNEVVRVVVLHEKTTGYLPTRFLSEGPEDVFEDSAGPLRPATYGGYTLALDVQATLERYFIQNKEEDGREPYKRGYAAGAWFGVTDVVINSEKNGFLALNGGCYFFSAFPMEFTYSSTVYGFVGDVQFTCIAYDGQEAFALGTHPGVQHTGGIEGATAMYRKFIFTGPLDGTGMSIARGFWSYPGFSEYRGMDLWSALAVLFQVLAEIDSENYRSTLETLPLEGEEVDWEPPEFDIGVTAAQS